MTTKTPNISVVSHCPKCNAAAYAGGWCRECGFQLADNKQEERQERTRSLVDAFQAKERLALGMRLISLSEDGNGGTDI